MANEGQNYPFLFYGAAPSDWFDPEGGEFSYELCFLSAPDARAREKAQAAFAQALGVEGASPWLWAGGRWALARLRPPPSKREGVRAAFKAASEALKQVHALAPLGQAVLLEALDIGDDPWDAHTLEARPSPDPGPRWPNAVTLSPGEGRPEVAVDGPDGEHGGRDAAAGDADDEPAGVVHDEPAGGVDDEASDGGASGDPPESSIAPGRVTLAPVRRPASEARSAPAPELRKAFGDGTVLGTTSAGLAYGWAKRQKRSFTFAWLEGDERRESTLTSTSASADVAPSPDGRAALVAPSGNGELWIVSFEDGSARKIWTHPNDEVFADVAWAGEGRVAAADYDGSLYVVSFDAGGGRTEKRIGGASPDAMRAALDGRALLVSDTDGEAGLSVIGVGPSSFKLLARFEGDFTLEDASADPPLVRDEDDNLYELRGLEGAYRAAFDEGSPDFPDAPDYEEPKGEDHSVPHAPGRVGFERRHGDDRPPLPLPPEGAEALFGATNHVRPTPSGGAFGFICKPRKPLQFAYLAGGALRAVALNHARHNILLAARPDGGAALTNAPETEDISEVVFESGAVHKLASNLPFLSYALAYLEGGAVAALATDSLYLLRRGEGGLEEAARLAVDRSTIFSTLGGRVLVASGWQEPSLDVYGVSGTELRLLGRFQPQIEALFERDGRVYVTDDSGGEIYELIGLDEAHQKAFSSRDDEAYPPVEPYREEQGDEGDESTEGDDESDDEPPKPPGSYAVNAAPGKVGLRHLEGFEPPDEPSMPKEVGRLFGGASNAAFYRGVAYGWKKESRRSYRFAFFRDGVFSETQFSSTSSPSSIMALREPDFGAALAAIDGDRELWQVDAHGGRARKLWRVEDKDDEIYAVEFLADGHYVVLGSDSTYVLAPEGEGARVLARLNINASDVHTSFDGRSFILDGVSGEGVWIIGLGPGGRLKTLAHFGEADPNDVRNNAGRCVVELDDGGWYEVTGLDEALRAAFEGGGAFDDPPPYTGGDDDESDDEGDESDDESEEEDDDESSDDESSDDDEGEDDESDDDEDDEGDEGDEDDDDESDD